MSARLQHVSTTSSVMFEALKGDLYGDDTQQFIKGIIASMKEKSHRLSREMTKQLIHDELALTAHADSMRSVAKFMAELPKDLERAEKYKDRPAFMETALERACYLYAQFQAMEMGLT